MKGLFNNLKRTVFLPRKIASKYYKDKIICETLGIEDMSKRIIIKILSHHIGFLIAMYDTMQDISKKFKTSDDDFWITLIFSRLRLNIRYKYITPNMILDEITSNEEICWELMKLQERFVIICKFMLGLDYGEMGFSPQLRSLSAETIINVLFPIFCEEVPSVLFNES